MHIVSLIDSFKGSFSAQAAASMTRESMPHHVVSAFPVSDGGEGFVHAWINSSGGVLLPSEIPGPDGVMFRSAIGYHQQTETVVLASSEGAGFEKVRTHDPHLLSSYGVGIQLRQALAMQPKTILLGLGGTATVDGGIGMLMGLGGIFKDAQGNLLDPYDFPLGSVTEIDLSQLDPGLASVSIVLASDVENPLLGAQGAVRVFGPQKGIRKEELPLFESRMHAYATLLTQITGDDQRTLPGSGAAGGIGYALSCVAETSYVSGARLILQAPEVIRAISTCDLLLSGEGRIDTQTMDGKLISEVTRLAEHYHKPLLLICGQDISKGKLSSPMLTGILSINPWGQSRLRAIKNSAENFRATLEMLDRLLAL